MLGSIKEHRAAECPSKSAFCPWHKVLSLAPHSPNTPLTLASPLRANHRRSIARGDDLKSFLEPKREHAVSIRLAPHPGRGCGGRAVGEGAYQSQFVVPAPAPCEDE